MNQKHTPVYFNEYAPEGGWRKYEKRQELMQKIYFVVFVVLFILSAVEF